MKIILFLVAIYSLIINQCQQKIAPSRTPASYSVPAGNDSLAEASSAIRPGKKSIPENNKPSLVSLNYTLAGTVFFKKY